MRRRTSSGSGPVGAGFLLVALDLGLRRRRPDRHRRLRRPRPGHHRRHRSAATSTSVKPARISHRRFLPSRCWSYSSSSSWIDQREAGQRGLHLVQAFLDALGDGDFAFAGQQLDGAHLAHVHAHRIGGAADLGVDGREQGDGFFGGGLVVRAGWPALSGSSGSVSGATSCTSMPTPLIIADDVFDLLRIDDVVGQVIVDLGVGQVALLQTLGDELLDFGLLLVELC